jgi:hypothetical protein
VVRRIAGVVSGDVRTFPVTSEVESALTTSSWNDKSLTLAGLLYDAILFFDPWR